jgi:hypothetical protein
VAAANIFSITLPEKVRVFGWLCGKIKNALRRPLL